MHKVSHSITKSWTTRCCSINKLNESLKIFPDFSECYDFPRNFPSFSRFSQIFQFFQIFPWLSTFFLFLLRILTIAVSNISFVWREMIYFYMKFSKENLMVFMENAKLAILTTTLADQIFFASARKRRRKISLSQFA